MLEVARCGVVRLMSRVVEEENAVVNMLEDREVLAVEEMKGH